MKSSESNVELRKLMKQEGVTFWKVGEKMGVCENTVTRWMRTELPPDKKAWIEKAIYDVLEERVNVAK